MILLGDKLGESSKTDPDADDDTEDSEDDRRAVADAENLKCHFVFLNANILAGKSSLRQPKLKQTKKVSPNTFFSPTIPFFMIMQVYFSDPVCILLYTSTVFHYKFLALLDLFAIVRRRRFVTSISKYFIFSLYGS